MLVSLMDKSFYGMSHLQYQLINLANGAGFLKARWSHKPAGQSRAR